MAGIDRGEEHVKVAAILRDADPGVLGEDRILFKGFGHGGNVLLGDAVSEVVRGLRSLAGIPEAERGDGVDGLGNLLIKRGQSGGSGCEFLKGSLSTLGTNF